ncbi:hypothetical protein [Ensifer adhaerens]|uniref:hypothetical protein n=1 Tax=Ensifer adhaerens TaxID=106592 RepID=UPI0018F7ED82|nr:hypothetical protein [Ensifer adhaerens]
MFTMTGSTTLLPHEIDEIDHIFQDILRERGLSQDCEAAEAIARRILSYYQRGVRDSGALKRAFGFDKRSVTQGNLDALVHVNPVATMQEVAGGSGNQISPDDLEMLQRTFDRVCIWCGVPRYGKRADRLAGISPINFAGD